MLERLTDEHLQEIEARANAARQDIAALLAEIRALTEERDAARQNVALEAYRLFAKHIAPSSPIPEVNLFSGIFGAAAELIAKHFNLSPEARISEEGK